MFDAGSYRFVPCPGCGVRLPSGIETMPVHGGASMACWNAYQAILSREFDDLAYPEVHRLTVDAYAAQHPGRPTRQTVHSVALHLIGLYYVHECRMALNEVSGAMRHTLDKKDAFYWLEPPERPEWMTIQDIHALHSVEAHTQQVYHWSKTVWLAWRAHHDIIKHWADIH